VALTPTVNIVTLKLRNSKVAGDTGHSFVNLTENIFSSYVFMELELGLKSNYTAGNVNKYVSHMKLILLYRTLMKRCLNKN
jgi:hypothetical protein